MSESLDSEACQPAVLAGVEATAEALRARGAAVETTSIPLWSSGFAIWVGTLVGGWPPVLRAGSTGFGHLGLIEVERAHAAGVVRRTQSHLLPSTIKLVLLVNAYLDERYQGVPLTRAHNQRLALRHALDEALGRYDLLLAPTGHARCGRAPHSTTDARRGDEPHRLRDDAVRTRQRHGPPRAGSAERARS